MKIYAKQVPPEYQESPLFLGDEFWPENVFVFGNRDFNDHSGRIKDIRAALEDIASEFERLQNGEFSDYIGGYSLIEILKDFLPRDDGREYARAERLRIVQLANNYCNCRSYEENDILCAALEIVTGDKYENATIRGCCQGDWQEIIYPAAYGREWLEHFETEYFNTGSEWIVHDSDTTPDGPEDIDGFIMYAHGWNEEQIKKEIANAYGTPDGDVILYKHAGYTKTSIYEVV